MNKLFIVILVTLSAALQSVSAYAVDRGFERELGGAMQFVMNVDTKKRVIYMSRSQLAYNSVTEFYNEAGDKIDADKLGKGRPIKYQIDHTKPYLHRPMAIKVWMK